MVSQRMRNMRKNVSVERLDIMKWGGFVSRTCRRT